jgi:hypothetical protein
VCGQEIRSGVTHVLELTNISKWTITVLARAVITQIHTNSLAMHTSIQLHRRYIH